MLEMRIRVALRRIHHRILNQSMGYSPAQGGEVVYAGLDSSQLSYNCDVIDIQLLVLLQLGLNTSLNYFCHSLPWPAACLNDMWTGVFASIGTSTTGNRAGNLLIEGSAWKGAVPAGMTEVKSPTDTV
jgi:hypothetical protein